MTNPNIAVLIPCHNEALAIKQVIQDFRMACPTANIYVYDNNSTDNTIETAKLAGATVRQETSKGKGHVVRRMFADIEADIYVMVDGDATYDATAAPQMIKKLQDEQLDMVVGTRVEAESSGKAYRRGHRLGNKLFTHLIAWLFGKSFSDVFSGYRVFSRRFVKSFPAESRKFEIETELTIHSLEQRLPTAEVETTYIERTSGSVSKLNSYQDGVKILVKIIQLLKETRPFLFFSSIFIALAVSSLALFFPVLVSYFKTGLVARFPTAFLSMGLMLLAFMSLACGIILDNVCRSRRALFRLFYLNVPANHINKSHSQKAARAVSNILS
tara:strand:- start:1360 stop:2343 length:984 start_codon:yes stop_codon:yes gene_type:complete